MARELTDRQQEILDLLVDRALPARDIAEQLGITRNAVYSTIARLRQKGALDPNWTPSGEVRYQGGEHAVEAVEHIAGVAPRGLSGTTTSMNGCLDIIRELVQQNTKLVDTVATLSARR